MVSSRAASCCVSLLVAGLFPLYAGAAGGTFPESGEETVQKISGAAPVNVKDRDEVVSGFRPAQRTVPMSRQEAELIALQNEFVRLVQEANKNVKGEIVWHQKRAVAMIRLKLSKAITNGRKVLKDKSKYSIVSQSLTDFLQEKLTRENRGYIFQSVQ